MEKTFLKDTRFLLGGILILSISFIYVFNLSLAKYRKQIDGNINVNIAKWNIKINNEDVLNQSNLTADIIPSFPGDSHTAPNVIAPGGTGYCDLAIDATDVDVDFTYAITFSTSQDSAITDLRITGYILNPSATNTTITPYNSATPVGGTITHNTALTTIRIYFTWYDGNDNNMSNADDTDAAIDSTSEALINASITFAQVLN